MIEVRNLYKEFAGVEILKDISIKFNQGKVNMIIGESGSGKTVLMKSIVGLHEIDKGEILFDEDLFSSMDVDQKKGIRKKIGMLFQGSALFDSLTVEENVRFPLTMLTDMSDKEQEHRANECLSRVNLENKNNLFPSEISGGMMKRVGIARAIALKPRYLFCDEPNSGLDPKTSIIIDNLIKDITEEFDITTIVISHDMNSVIEIGDNINFILKGVKHWSGNREDILKTDDPVVQSFVYASKFIQQKRT
ncbi:MAG: ATP-binding cassette domain-containing protein [Flavobacteriales bacterium]|nr:ATP-binding cassette domain-containing protein [Flavobacteriales bacterium]